MYPPFADMHAWFLQGGALAVDGLTSEPQTLFAGCILDQSWGEIAREEDALGLPGMKVFEAGRLGSLSVILVWALRV